MAFLLGGCFGALSVLTQTPEFALAEGEVGAITEAVENVGKFYVGAVDPKSAAWVKLAMTVGGIAGIHMVAYRIRIGQQPRFRMRPMPQPTQQSPQSQDQNATHFDGPDLVVTPQEARAPAQDTSWSGTHTDWQPEPGDG